MDVLVGLVLRVETSIMEDLEAIEDVCSVRAVWLFTVEGDTKEPGCWVWQGEVGV